MFERWVGGSTRYVLHAGAVRHVRTVDEEWSAHPDTGSVSDNVPGCAGHLAATAECRGSAPRFSDVCSEAFGMQREPTQLRRP